MRNLVLGGLACLVLATGCDQYRTVKVRFAREFECREELKTRSLGAGAVRVSGCGRSASYVCSGSTCVRDRGAEEEQQWQGPVAAPSKPRSWSQVQVARTPQGARMFRVKVGSRQMALHLQAVPGQDHEVVNVGLRVAKRRQPLQGCALRFMVDGRLLEMGETGYRLDRGYEELRSAMSYDDLFAMAESSRVVGRVCHEEFRLGDAQVEAVRELVLRIKEELTWQEEAAPAATPAPADAGAAPPPEPGSEIL